jgi:hypothetical protein
MAGNANGKNIWNLAKDGVLWKKVIEHASKEIKDQASELVGQLQDSVSPTDVIQGLLLDRIAAGFLRKHALLEVQAAIGELAKLNAQKKDSGGSSQILTLRPVAMNHHLGLLYSTNLLRYESLLDQTFHRDLMLLQELKKAAIVAAPLNGKDRKTAPRLIEGQIPGQLV